MAASTVASLSMSMSILIFFVLLAAAATATAAAATPTDVVAIDEAYAHLVKVTGDDQDHSAERAQEARAYNRAEYMNDPVAVMDRFEDAAERTAAVEVRLSPSSLPRKFRAGAARPPPTPSNGAAGGAAAEGPDGTGSASWAGAPSASSAATRPQAASSPTTPPASSPTNRGNLQHAIVQDSSLWITFARDMI